MTEITKNNETDQESSVYDELPDAPPKQKLKLSWTGKIGVAIVAFWILMVFIGPYVAPFHEADIIAEDSYLDPDGTYRWDRTWEDNAEVSDIAIGPQGDVHVSGGLSDSAFFGASHLAIAASVRLIRGIRSSYPSRRSAGANSTALQQAHRSLV